MCPYWVIEQATVHIGNRGIPWCGAGSFNVNDMESLYVLAGWYARMHQLLKAGIMRAAEYSWRSIRHCMRDRSFRGQSKAMFIMCGIYIRMYVQTGSSKKSSNCVIQIQIQIMPMYSSRNAV